MYSLHQLYILKNESLHMAYRWLRDESLEQVPSVESGTTKIMMRTDGSWIMDGSEVHRVTVPHYLMYSLRIR